MDFIIFKHEENANLVLEIEMYDRSYLRLLWHDILILKILHYMSLHGYLRNLIIC